MLLVLLTIAGPIVLVTVVLVIVFAAIRRANDRAAAALAPEGIELDSGRVTVTVRLRGAFRRNPARVVLTKRRLYILQRPQRLGAIERADLARFTVGISDGMLQLRSDAASIDVRIAVRDPDAWVAALAGASRVA